MDPIERKTPLHDEHVRLGALMAPFAGWQMPIHYGSILDEARHTRTAVSLFDISHMGEFIVREDPGSSSLDFAITIPVVSMRTGRCKYGFLLHEKGGFLDDLIAYRIRDDEWMLVVNASNEARDFDTIRGLLSGKASITNISSEIVKLDLQGPMARDVLVDVAGRGISALSYFGFDHFELFGASCLISRTGYTGELGYEIYADPERGALLWTELLKNSAVRPAGLGARDILRLEMGLPLYGHELDEETTPAEAGMERFLDMGKEFNGKEAVRERIATGPRKRLVGLLAEGRRTPRHENPILWEGRRAGVVTSGAFSPHLGRGIGMGYIATEGSGRGTAITVDTGKGDFPALVETVPFLTTTSIK
ncbi:MAG: glycine cleavage system aminomethyltransferase GcvT [Spirochaetes bacterium]|nr:glycine cleavage system aminomethyltransferase GcvT [Spirochaetota bacterium]